ncbi:MAG: squalene/phytoene synthase family protein [Planctomycetes bacterium]|nr:squalene/phytoene synthase family protein [Planctomycetota bacterium]
MIGSAVVKDALQVLEATSRTFFIPIRRLPDGLREAVASAYLCMRSIDEIEDHRLLGREERARLLRAISLAFQATKDGAPARELALVFAPFAARLPEVTLRLGEWAVLAPASIRWRVLDATAAMAERMALWAENGFRVRDEPDLERYTYGVAGAVGVLLSDLFAWHDGTETDRAEAVGFGRGLQAVNILRNRREDLERGADFFPEGWPAEKLMQYARANLALAARFTARLAEGPIREFCAVPLALAEATLDALMRGQDKLTRAEVAQVVERALGRAP